MSGSEQFLGQQLSKQATALGLLVDKMGQVVDSVVPKYTVESENLKYTLTTDSASSRKIILNSYIDGTIKIKAKGTTRSGLTGGLMFTVNGVVMKTISYGIDENDVLKEGTVKFRKGDEVAITSSSNSNMTNVTAYIYYDIEIGEIEFII